MYNVVKCFVCCAMFCLQAKLSRFMDWAIKFRNLRPYWSFLRKVYETYKILKGQAQGPAGESEAEEELPRQAADDADMGKRRRAQVTQESRLIADFKQMDKKRHVCDIVLDILNDSQVKQYASMNLASITEAWPLPVTRSCVWRV